MEGERTKVASRIPRAMAKLTGDAVSHVGIFDPALRSVTPLTFSLVLLSPRPSLCEYVVQYTRKQCVRGVWGSGTRTDKHLPQNPFTGKFF
jgi:hypothetical protein